MNESRNEPPIRNTNLKYYETDNPDMRRTVCISQAGQPQALERGPEAKKKSRDLAKVMVLLETSIDLGSGNTENQ